MVTLRLSPEKESELRTNVVLENRQRAKEILVEAIEPTLDALIEQQKNPPRSFEEIMAELDRIMEKAFGPEGPPHLPDEAFTRAAIYGDHP
jgi:hypothetical protein